MQDDDWSNNILGVQTTTVQKPETALDLFCGIGSATRVLTECGFEFTSLDIDPNYYPVFCCDVMTLEYTRLPRSVFDVITMSPPCTKLSKAKTVVTLDLVGAIAVIQKPLEIIRYFRPLRCFLETPRYALLPEKTLCKYFHFGTWINVNMGMEDSGNLLGFMRVDIFWLSHRHCVTEYIARIWLKDENNCAIWVVYLGRHQKS